MTLSPVFRSESAVRLLRDEGIWERLLPAIESQAHAVRLLHRDLESLLGARHRVESAVPEEGTDPFGPEGLIFLQEYFFLILFHSLFESAGVAKDRLGLYAELNFCVKGTITAADNLFDDQGKSLLPLRTGVGSRFLSILQLMCFERLLRGTLDRGESGRLLGEEDRERISRELLDAMAVIGILEGSEEGGIDGILEPERMIERVHRVRGGALFSLAFVAPLQLEVGGVIERLRRAEPAVARLGTAFQIVDDLTDFEFDLPRRSHNILASWVFHRGSSEERRLLARLHTGSEVAGWSVERDFSGSAREVLEVAYREAEMAFSELAEIGFWFPPHRARAVVQAIVGLDGVARMELLSKSEEP